MPVRALTQWQAATEVTWGTPVSPTVRLMGVSKSAKMMAGNKTGIYEDVRNGFQGSDLVGLEQMGGKADLPLMATFEDLPYYFDNAFGQASPTGTGPYVRTYQLPVGSLTAPRILTLVHGNSQTGGGVYTLTGGLITQLKFSVKLGGPAQLTASFIGKQVDTSQSLQSLSDRSVTTIMGQPWAVYMDTWGGTIGTTQLTATVVGFDLTIALARQVVRSVDAVAPDTWEQTGHKVSLDLTLRFNATAKTQVDAYVAQTAAIQKQIRLKQTNSTQICQLDVAGTITKNNNIYDDQNEVLTTTMGFEGTYNSSLANQFKASITNSVSTLA